MHTMSASAESEVQGRRYVGGMKRLAGSNESWNVGGSGQLLERRAGGREFQILGDVIEKLQEPNAVRNRMVGCLVF